MRAFQPLRSAITGVRDHHRHRRCCGHHHHWARKRDPRRRRIGHRHLRSHQNDLRLRCRMAPYLRRHRSPSSVLPHRMTAWSGYRNLRHRKAWSVLPIRGCSWGLAGYMTRRNSDGHSFRHRSSGGCSSESHGCNSGWAGCNLVPDGCSRRHSSGGYMNRSNYSSVQIGCTSHSHIRDCSPGRKVKAAEFLSGCFPCWGSSTCRLRTNIRAGTWLPRAVEPTGSQNRHARCCQLPWPDAKCWTVGRHSGSRSSRHDRSR